MCVCVCVYIYCVTLNNITSLNNLLLNLYFENLIVELHVLYVLNKHAKFHTN